MSQPSPEFHAAVEKITGSAETLLREWYEWWAASDEAPVKMPDALHVRTAMLLMEPMDAIAALRAPSGADDQGS